MKVHHGLALLFFLAINSLSISHAVAQDAEKICIEQSIMAAQVMDVRQNDRDILSLLEAIENLSVSDTRKVDIYRMARQAFQVPVASIQTLKKMEEDKFKKVEYDDCVLGLSKNLGKKFDLADSGAVRDSLKEPRNGEKGFILLNNKRMEYLDLVSEDALDNAGKDVTIYGYLWSFIETDPLKVWGYRFDLDLYEGKKLAYIGTMGLSSPMIDVVIVADQSKKYPEPVRDTLVEKRKENYKALEISKRDNVLVKIEGETVAFSNTGKLFIKADTMTIVP